MTDRKSLIESIVNASRRPCPTIVELRRARNKITGQVHSTFGLPANFRAEDYETFSAGYVYKDIRSGTTYGIVYKTRESAESEHAARDFATAAVFRTALEEMDDNRLGEQAAFWLKHGLSATF